jgi:hypothetical protein
MVYDARAGLNPTAPVSTLRGNSKAPPYTFLHPLSHCNKLTPSANKDTPLDCWRQVDAFKAEVAKLEQAFVKSLQ